MKVARDDINGIRGGKPFAYKRGESIAPEHVKHLDRLGLTENAEAPTKEAKK